MKKNMGNMDRNVRLVLAAVIALLIFTNVVSGTFAILLGILAVIFVATSLINFCPLYPIFGINTCKTKN